MLETMALLQEVKNPEVVAAMFPSVMRGNILQLGKLQETTDMVSGHAAHFDWTYESDFPEMRTLYRRAKENQWNSETALDWGTDVDPMNPEKPLLPKGFFGTPKLKGGTLQLSAKEERQLNYDAAAWMLSQFLHGEQGALFAASQVTESVEWYDGKLYGATQVMDEGRHVETFHRYIDEKLNKLYIINDNLFTIIDSLMTDSRWDMKFLGMQIMVEGLALGAFGMLYRITREPLLKELLRYVIQDEARHVHYGVLALREHFTNRLSDKEKREREDWAFEIALLMRNRFMAHEVYEEWFEGLMTRKEWNENVLRSPGMSEFRQVMFSRLVPNLRYIGLLPDRMMEHYEEAGLLRFLDGKSAAELSGEEFLQFLDTGESQFDRELEELADGGHDHEDHSPQAAE
jgi:hypothetical protein